MIHYTDALMGIIEDVVARVEPLSFIDPARLLVFGRCGRTGAQGAYATCHSLNLPTSEPGYYYWRDRKTGALTRRTEWFVIRTPEVSRHGRRIDYMLSFTIPRFCDQTFEGARKAKYYRSVATWVAKLDTIVHELYHISPNSPGLRTFTAEDGGRGKHCVSFLAEVARLVEMYLDTNPPMERLDFLRYDFRELVRRYGGVLGTSFRNYPSYPQRFSDRVTPQPALPDVPIVPVERSSQPRRYTERDLRVRLFGERSSRLQGVPLDPAA